MKKTAVLFYIFIVLISFMFIKDNAFAFNINEEIPQQAIDAPLSLPEWTPPWYSVSVVTETIKHFNILRNVIAPVATGTGLIKKPDSTTKPNDKRTEISVNNDINSIGNEEILYNIDFTNSKETPIHYDTEIFIKIPEEFNYSEGSTKFNNKKLTDEIDKDRLTFLRAENTLKINLKGVNKNKRISINFGAKPLVPNISGNSTYCMIKFQSKSNNSKLDWKPFSAL